MARGRRGGGAVLPQDLPAADPSLLVPGVTALPSVSLPSLPSRPSERAAGSPAAALPPSRATSQSAPTYFLLRPSAALAGVREHGVVALLLCRTRPRPLLAWLPALPLEQRHGRGEARTDGGAGGPAPPEGLSFSLHRCQLTAAGPGASTSPASMRQGQLVVVLRRRRCEDLLPPRGLCEPEHSPAAAAADLVAGGGVEAGSGGLVEEPRREAAARL
jgi:hypothetical protein